MVWVRHSPLKYVEIPSVVEELWLKPATQWREAQPGNSCSPTPCPPSRCEHTIGWPPARSTVQPLSDMHINMLAICYPATGGITPRPLEIWMQWPVTNFEGHRQTLFTLPVWEINLILFSLSHILTNTLILHSAQFYINLRQQINGFSRWPTKLQVCNVSAINFIVFTKVSYCQHSPLDNIWTKC